MGTAKMKLFVASVLVGLALGAPQNLEKDLETVPYTVVATHKVGENSFEERNYEGGLKWVCTKSKGNDNGMFQKLYQYIAGANSENENIDMTTPVSTKWDKTGSHEECFYLNKEHQLNPPKPTSPDVYIVTRPAMTIYTRKITKHWWHHMTVEEWMKESADLDKMIKSLGFKVKSDEMYVNGYTSPMSFNQRSELWKVKETEEKSSQDNRIETAPYTVVATHYVGFNTFEERDYEEIKWVCTNSEGQGSMFRKLYDYISGRNTENEKMDMTAPVSTKWSNDGFYEECFYLNRKHQQSPPEPSSPEVYIVTRPAMTVFTRRVDKYFWHFMNEEEWMKESSELDEMIHTAGFHVKSDEMYVSGYTDPFQFHQRSELWKIKEE